MDNSNLKINVYENFRDVRINQAPELLVLGTPVNTRKFVDFPFKHRNVQYARVMNQSLKIVGKTTL